MDLLGDEETLLWMGEFDLDFFSDLEEEEAGIGVNWGNHAGGVLVVDDTAVAGEDDVAVDGHGDAVGGILKGFSGI